LFFAVVAILLLTPPRSLKGNPKASEAPATIAPSVPALETISPSVSVFSPLFL